MKKCIAFVLCAAILMGQASCAAPERSTGDAAVTYEWDFAPEAGSYQEYLEAQAAVDAEAVISIDSSCLTDSESAEHAPQYQGYAGNCVLTAETGFVTYTFSVETEGLYQIELDYYPMKGKGAAIVRNLLLDGELPYNEAREIEFSRIWGNDGAIRQDSRGNDIRPSQIELPAWQSAFVRDSSGFYTQPLKLYLSPGTHQLTLESVREPMAVGEIRLCTAETAPAYEEYLALHQAETGVTGFYEMLQGEEAVRKSSQVIYPITDRSSASTVPNSPSNIRLNTLGGEKWQTAGHWVEWTVTVPKSGLYKMAGRVRQNVVQGAFSTRRLTVNGKVPFAEAENIQVGYDMAWQYLTLAGKDGEPYYLYLEEGENTLRLEAVLGDMSALLRETFACVRQLNDIYQQILMITGPVPDVYRNYRFHQQTPQLLKDLLAVSERLTVLYEQYQSATGESGQSAATLNKLAMQTKAMGEDQRKIATSFSDFKSNIVALGDFVVTLRKQPLEIDFMEIASPDKELTEKKANFWEGFLFVIQSFLASFLDDYSNLGGDAEGADAAITVWVGSGSQAGVATAGRDQAQVIKQMAETMFTPAHNIAVNIQLVSAGSLLSAVLSGNAPDVALSLGGSEPVNYAVRNAVVNLSQFEDCAEVCGRFMDSALTPLSFDGKLYGLPETQSYYMLFYRKDILEEMGLTVPQTWDDVIAMLPQLQKNQMEFGLPPALSDTVGIGFNGYAMFLYQNGGEFYLDGGEASALTSGAAIDSFYQWTKFYTEYGLVPLYDFATRFRMGDMPIAIADYTLYNQISVFAPELRGLWDFAPVPGTRRADGTIDRSVAGSVTAGVILSASEEPDAAWEFLKWWTSTEVQVAFGLELESIMGAAARYATANVQALEQLPWNKSDIDNLKAQWEWVKGVPEVPGGYYTARYIDFAFRRVYYRAEEPGETLEDIAVTIDEELTAKRREFNLSTR